MEYNMLNIGCHLSSSKGFKHMGEEALTINANTFQFFSRNPRGSKAKAVDKKDTEKLNEIAKNNNFAPILAHAPYTLNACSSDEGLREFARNTMASDLEIMEYIPNNLYNFHPGSHVGQGVDIAIDYIYFRNRAFGCIRPNKVTDICSNDITIIQCQLAKCRICRKCNVLCVFFIL